MIYRFYYSDRKIEQTKILVAHSDYLIWKNMPSETDEEIEAKEKFWKEKTGGKEWFTDQSPYFRAIESGVVDCNGKHKCEATLISS